MGQADAPLSAWRVERRGIIQRGKSHNNENEKGPDFLKVLRSSKKGVGKQRAGGDASAGNWGKRLKMSTGI